MSFHIDDKVSSYGDILKTYLFELDLSNALEYSTAFPKGSEEGLNVKVRSASIPARGNEPIQSVYQGQKQFFAGQPTFTNTLDIVFEEFEDQKVIQFLYDWNQQLYSQNPLDLSGGAAKLATKRLGYACDITLKMLDYKKNTLKKSWKFVHAWPSQVQEIGLDMGDNNSVKINAQFTYDYWILEEKTI